MSSYAIRAQGLSKQYRIGALAAGNRHLRDAIVDLVARPYRQLKRLRGAASAAETLWALRDISFEILPGEVVAIIGRNGAGKSTLLKILSRITDPTSGSVRICGGIASLLEVGTGFHPELTGRENVYLNGALHGMTKVEISRKFDEIVSFADVERFVDTPVKQYSTGMGLRLAFAVAAHLNPEIMVIDEVLAVGDVEFQRKCLGKMKDVARSGRTVLFVSHNLAAVRSLCTRAILLNRGQLVCDSSVEECLQTYSVLSGDDHGDSWEREAVDTRKALSISKVIVQLHGQQPDHTLEVTVRLESQARHRSAFIALEIVDVSGTAIMQPLPTIEGFISDERREHTVRLTVDLPPLIPGRYLVTVWVGSHNTETLDEIRSCAGFEITQSPTKNRTYPHTSDHGYIVPHTRLEYSHDR